MRAASIWLLDVAEDFIELLFGLNRFGQATHCAHAQAAVIFFVGGDDLHGNMAGGQIVFEAIENAPSVDIGEIDIERDGCRDKLPGHLQCGRSARGDNGLEIIFMGHIEQETGKIHVVFDNENDRVPGVDIVDIIFEGLVQQDEVFGLCFLLRTSFPRPWMASTVMDSCIGSSITDPAANFSRRNPRLNAAGALDLLGWSVIDRQEQRK